jgi:hypothetical protein
MNARFALLLIALLPLAACKNETPAPVVDAQTQTTDAAPPAAKQASAEDPATMAKAKADAQAAAESAAKSPPPVLGTDYAEIPNSHPFDTTDGRIELVEIFGYVCPYCGAVQPTVRAMKANLPSDVHMVYVPAAFGSMWDTYAKAYYTADASPPSMRAMAPIRNSSSAAWPASPSPPRSIARANGFWLPSEKTAQARRLSSSMESTGLRARRSTGCSAC